MKKTVEVCGKLLFPLQEGHCAVIVRGTECIYTSLVVEILEQSAERACFETMNSIYRVSLQPVPVKMTMPPFLAMCA